jgi:hypothetical protein
MINQIASFDDAVTKQVFMARINKLAADIAKEMGVEVNNIGNVNSNYNVLTFNMSFKVKNPKYSTKTHSQVFGTGPIKIEEIIRGFKVRLKTHMFEVTGINHRNYKNCVSLRRDDGKLMKASYDTIVSLGKRV